MRECSAGHRPAPEVPSRDHPAVVREEVFPEVAPIFVVGAPRSGTTLCARLLDAHPEIAIADEITFFDIILKAREVVPELDDRAAIATLFELLPRMDHARYWQDVEPVLAAVRTRLEGDPEPSYQKFFLFFMQEHARRRGASRYGDKTPWNVRHLETIARWFPNAKIIHMVRDPRAHIASKRKLPRTSQDVVTSTVKWLIDIAAATRFARSAAAAPDRFVEIRYEDLVREPAAALRRICEVIGVRFLPEMLEFHRSADVMFRDQPWKEGVLRPLSVASVDRWREELTDAQVLLIELLTARVMRRYGYPRARVPFRTRLDLPRQLVHEFRLWRAFKRAEKIRQQAEPEIAFTSGAGDLYRVLLRSLWRQISRSR